MAEIMLLDPSETLGSSPLLSYKNPLDTYFVCSFIVMLLCSFLFVIQVLLMKV
jgi:hypothetical protein